MRSEGRQLLGESIVGGDAEESGFDAEETAPLADEIQLDEEQTPLPCTRTPAHPSAPISPYKNPLAS